VDINVSQGAYDENLHPDAQDISAKLVTLELAEKAKAKATAIENGGADGSRYGASDRSRWE